MGIRLSKTSQLKALEKRFDTEELFTLRQTFAELAFGNRGRFIDREAFKLVFRMPGVLSDRLFNAFDLTHSDMIDYESFITGLALFIRGSFEERIDFLFRIYDIDQNERISKEGLTTVLNSVLFAGYLIISSQSDPERISDTISDVISKRTKKLVDDAFRYHSNDHLTKEQFRRWAQDNTIEVEYALHVLIRDRNACGQKSFSSRKGSSFDFGRVTFDGILRSSRSQKGRNSSSRSQSSSSQEDPFQDTSSFRRTKARLEKSESTQRLGVHFTCQLCDYDISAYYCAYCGMPLQNRSMTLSCQFCIAENRCLSCHFCVNCGSDLQATVASGYKYEPIFGETVADDNNVIQGCLYKISNHLGIANWTQRWCRLAGNFLYTYSSEASHKPSGMICLEDAYVECIDHSNFQTRMKYGLQIYSPINQLERCFYAPTELERDEWFRSLRQAARQFCFEDFYHIDGKIGEGKFSNVFACTRKQNNRDYAVKVINKYDVRECDRNGLRTEIAVLQFVHHPNIVHLKNVFETHSRMYIVMSLVEGGDLFQRLKEHGRYCVDDARRVMIQLLRALQYLHERGIVHRDLKPENIMLISKDSLTDIQLVDFGLSKFVAPEEKMNQTCGTLWYLAPEVLLRKGYGREVDIWSAGVILYVMLCCRLPFPDKDVREYLAKTMNSQFNLDGDEWNEVSDDAKSLIRRMLDPNPRLRISVTEALEDSWLQMPADSVLICSR